MGVEFLVEQAGCASCAKLIREALGELGRIERVEVDEEADVALVGLEPNGVISPRDAQRILDGISAEAGHAYRVRPGSWRILAT